MVQSNDKSTTSFIWIVGIVLTIFCGAGLTVALSFGQTKQQVMDHEEDILRLKRRTVDYVYIQDLIQSNYMMIDIMKATPNTKEMDEALKTWREFQLSTMRRVNPTRSIQQNTK